MAKGYEKHKQRQEDLQRMGRDLARRAKSKCELCEQGQRALQTVEIEPIPDPPDLEHTLFLCERCQDGVDAGPLQPQPDWRFLETAMWSQTLPAQVTAVRLLRRLRDEDDCAWAREALDTLYLGPEALAYLGESAEDPDVP